MRLHHPGQPLLDPDTARPRAATSILSSVDNGIVEHFELLGAVSEYVIHRACDRDHLRTAASLRSAADRFAASASPDDALEQRRTGAYPSPQEREPVGRPLLSSMQATFIPGNILKALPVMFEMALMMFLAVAQTVEQGDADAAAGEMRAFLDDLGGLVIDHYRERGAASDVAAEDQADVRHERRPSAAAGAADSIRLMIFHGEPRPGERLSQDSLASRLGMSEGSRPRCSVAVAQEGRVTLEPYRGAFVSPITADGIVEDDESARRGRASPRFGRPAPRCSDQGGHAGSRGAFSASVSLARGSPPRKQLPHPPCCPSGRPATTLSSLKTDADRFRAYRRKRLPAVAASRGCAPPSMTVGCSRYTPPTFLLDLVRLNMMLRDSLPKRLGISRH